MTTFAQRLRAGEPLLGALLRMPNEALVELAGLAGLDYVVIDTEHGPGDQLALSHHVTAAAAAGLGVLVRVGAPGEVLRVLDLGPDGIIAPHVCDVDQARAYVAAAHYPPMGTRGFAAYTRAGHYGLRSAAEHHAAAREVVVVVMIEDPTGVDAAGDIAAVEGVDALMFGPADFACEIGALHAADDSRVAVARASVRHSAQAGGGASVSIVGSAAAAGAAFDAGDTVVMYNVQHLLTGLFTELASRRRPSAPAATWSGAAAGSPREPLVLLPGMLGDAAVWADVAAALQDVAVAHFARIDLDDSIGEMAETVLSTAPPRFALAGHSLGAVVALEVARRAPDRVSRLALVNASGRGPSVEQQQAWSTLLSRLDDEPFATIAAELARSTLPPGHRADAALLQANEAMAHSVGPAGLRRQLRAQQSRLSYLDGLGGARMPVLVVSGDLDDVCPPERQRELVARCPRAELVSVADAGHLAPLERPAAVAIALREWLRR